VNQYHYEIYFIISVSTLTLWSHSASSFPPCLLSNITYTPYTFSITNQTNPKLKCSKIHNFWVPTWCHRRKIPYHETSFMHKIIKILYKTTFRLCAKYMKHKWISHLRVGPTSKISYICANFPKSPPKTGIWNTSGKVVSMHSSRFFINVRNSTIIERTIMNFDPFMKLEVVKQ
jgi:hypothetical protein